MTLQVQITGIEGLIKQLENLEISLKKNATEFLDDASKIIAKNISKELLSPIKSGVENPRQRSRTSYRRSTKSESLAYDRGDLMTLIARSKNSPNSFSVGFLKSPTTVNNPRGFDYAAYHEEANNRPTLEKAFEASKSELESLLDKKSKI